MKRILLLAALPMTFFIARGQTWSEDVAEIVYENCVSCHNPDGIGNVSFLTYETAFDYKSIISAYVSNNIMPPWTADSSFQHYFDERILTNYERTTILDWVSAGAPEGDASLAPPPPVLSEKILPGAPDLVVQMNPYMSKATPINDDYVCIALPTGLTEDRKLKAMEVIPGNRSIVHHCLVFHDEDGTYMTDTIGGDCSGPTTGELLGGYAPGSQPTIYPSGEDFQAGMEMKAGSNVIFAMHYPHGSYGEWDSTKVNFYFYDEPVDDFREVYAVPLLSNWSFTIEAETVHTVEEDMTIPIDWTFISALPHMHLLGESIETYGIDADDDTIPMVRIPKWDFEWQDIFYFRYFQPVMAGEKLYAKGVYNNTSANPFNPHTPPIDVSAGFDTEDEMFLIYYSFMVYEPGDEYVNQDSLNTIFLTNEYEKLERENVNGINVYPNPFNDEISIAYELEQSSFVSIFVYDLNGQVVKKLIREDQQSGAHSVKWDGTNAAGSPVENGLYFYSMMIDGEHYSGRMIKK
jgi:hypothetical protein